MSAREDWPLRPLRDITTKIGSGATPRGGQDAYAQVGVALIRSMNVYDFSFDTEGLARIDPEQARGLEGVTVFPDDVLLNITGASVARCCMVPRAILPARVNQHVAIVRLDSRKADPRFVLYAINSSVYKARLLSLAQGGATREALTKGTIEAFEVPCPAVATQRRIAGILSAYDDLIENCQRRIRILEDMARGLYREWFVHFRFPGADAQPRVDSPPGPIPQGWHVSTIGALTSKIGSGSTPRGGKDVYERAGISLIRSLNVYDYRFEPANLAFINDEQALTLRNVELREGDVLLNITGASVARCCLTPSYALPARVNQHVAIVRTDPQLANPFFVLDSINNEQNKQRLLGLAQGGATREALTKETIANFALIVPSVKLMQRYEFIASPIHQQRETLARRVANLHRTRDLLLPRLLSGQIDVGAAESMAGAEATEPAAAA